jgi:dolichol-phosphate mannosyltransferase
MMRPFVVVPTYNERNNLPALLQALLRTSDATILVVDDASPDGTGAEADRAAAASAGRVVVIHRTGARGFRRSYVDGMREALRLNATHVCQMDGDFSHDPADVPRLLEATRTADLAIGSRYVRGGALRDWPLHRVALSAFANHYVRLITRLPVRDCTSGFRCWRSGLLQQLPLDGIMSDSYAFQVEMTWNAHELGARIVEVPITFIERREGESKLSGHTITESALMPWRLIAHRHARVRS